MTYITILIASLLFVIIPLTSSALARQLHFMLGLQGEELNINAIFGKVGLWFLMENDSKLLNMFKDAVTCIYCITHHIAIIETVIAFTWLFGWYGLFALLLVPALALTIQNYLQKSVYSQYYSQEVDNNTKDNDGSN